jgi:hypothetical protein
VIIDLLDIYPGAINRFDIAFDTRIPLGFKIAYAGADKKFFDAVVKNKINGAMPQKQGAQLPLSFKLNNDGTPKKLRYIKLSFAKGLLRENIKLVDFSFQTDEGPAKDSEYDN